MKYANLIAFWGDISILALESLMFLNGETQTIQYYNVKNSTDYILKYMKKNELSQNEIEESVAVFLEVRKKFVNDGLSSKVPSEYIQSTLIALCIKHNADEEINDAIFHELTSEARSYLTLKYSASFNILNN